MLLQSPIISTYPDLERQTKRDACLDELALTIEHSRGDQPASDFRSHLSVIGKIEAGYAVLSRSLDVALGIGDATHWLWASLHSRPSKSIGRSKNSICRSSAAR